jgi:inward rectifier potassium channel
LKRQSPIQNIDNTGFAATSDAEGKRIANKDGTLNVRKTGLRFWERLSLYHSLLRMPRLKFLLSIFLFYGGLNLLFAMVYLGIGVEHLKGVEGDELSGFMQAFFFSSQTLTTVGYGHISPEGLATNIVASLESFTGILSFAMVTGLLYGRFTRPKAYLMFSDNAIIAPHKGTKALMFRTATYKNNHLTDVEAQLTIAFHVLDNGNKVTRFYPLPLEISKVNSLALSWTIVHRIDEDSPLYGMTLRDMQETNFEVLVFIKGFDDHFSNTVQQRTSYSVSDITYGAKFLPMFRRAEDGSGTILDLDKINAHNILDLPDIAQNYP